MERTFCIYGRDSLFGCHVESPSDAFLCRANGEVCKQQIDQTVHNTTDSSRVINFQINMSNVGKNYCPLDLSYISKSLKSNYHSCLRTVETYLTFPTVDAALNNYYHWSLISTSCIWLALWLYQYYMKRIKYIYFFKLVTMYISPTLYKK